MDFCTDLPLIMLLNFVAAFLVAVLHLVSITTGYICRHIIICLDILILVIPHHFSDISACRPETRRRRGDPSSFSTSPRVSWGSRALPLAAFGRVEVCNIKNE